uniref:Histone chaperone n=1 Tax=Caudovirales sp. ctu3532 TaxID=2827639 RepID=A0A8S5TIZ0_9CAUD|nr:MAG TPA: Histone chaperone [Caudovirales sp. ctu3532]
MAKIYALLIQKHKKTIEDVPEELRAEVEALLAEGAK